MEIVIGSKSEMKIKAISTAIAQFVPIDTLKISAYNSKSKVSETPHGKKTLTGARNRALDAKLNIPGAKLYIGIESGLVRRYGLIFEEAWCCIIDSNLNEFYGYSSGLKVPDYILEKMKVLKLPHYKTMELLQKELGIEKGDTWGNYSGSKLTRLLSIEEAARNALVQVFSTEKSLYKLSK